MDLNKVQITGVNTNDLKSLSQKEMNALLLELKKGNKDVKDILVMGNLKLVLSLMQRLNTTKVSKDDLFQVGCIGLIKAIDNFDLSYNCLFSTYAVPLILGEMKRYIRDHTLLRVSRSIKDRTYQVMQLKDNYMLEHGYEPSDSYLCKELGITLNELWETKNALVDPVSIYEPLYSEGGDTLYIYDCMADPNSLKNNKEDLLSLRKSLTHLSVRERNILEERYLYGKTQSELANDLHISQAQVSRIEKNSIKKLERLLK